MTQFDMLLRPGAIRVEFQPILALDQGRARLYAVEALARGPAGSSFERPDVLFEYARRRGEEGRLDLICISQALASAAPLPGKPSISLNVHGSTLSHGDGFAKRLLNTAEACGIAPERLMLEIVEHRACWDMTSVHATLALLRDAGVRIAVDDLGTGASNFRMVVDCRPDHLKIDRYIVKDCSRDPVRASVIASIAHLSRSIGAPAIAEGIEDDSDLDLVLSLGVDIIQGWLFAPAMPAHALAQTPYLQ